VVRPARPEDAQACAAIYANYVVGEVISFEEVPPGAEEMGRRMAGLSGSYPWLVAERDGEVAGYAYAGDHRSRAAYRWAADVSVYVSPAHHRAGVGRELYEDLFARLREQGVAVVCAGVTLPNEASVGLHEALGFTPVGVYRRIGWKLGKWHDVGWWQLSLLPQDDEPPAELRPPAAG
jgi:L-amino acid N-acyltransferase YncA